MLPDFSKNFAKQTISPGDGDMRKQNADAAAVHTDRRDVRVIIAWAIFIVSLITIAASYGAIFYFNRIIQDIELQIEEQETAIQTRTIGEIILFNEQIETRKSLAASRAGYLTIITEVANIIIPSVRFSSLAVSLKDDAYIVKIDAVAESLVAYLQQANVLRISEHPLIQRIMIDEYAIRRDDAGRNTVTFSLSLQVPISKVAAPAQKSI